MIKKYWYGYEFAVSPYAINWLFYKTQNEAHWYDLRVINNGPNGHKQVHLFVLMSDKDYWDEIVTICKRYSENEFKVQEVQQ